MTLSRRPHLATGLLVLAVAGLSLHAAHTAFGLGGRGLNALFDEWLYNALMLGAALACLVRGISVRTDRVSWLLLGAGLLSWSAGDLFFSLVLIDQVEVPVPSISDGLYLAFYPAACAGLALLVRRNVRELHLSLWIDALMGALAVSAVATVLLYDAVKIGVGGETARIATTLAYPVGDIALLAFVVGFFALTGWRPGGTWGLIGLALAIAGLGDAVFLWQSAHGTYAEGGLLDSVWPASAMLLAISAWRRPRLIEPRLDEFRILAMPSLFAALAMAVIVADQVAPLAPVAVALALGTLIMLIARLAHTLRVNLRMVAASRGEARTDALTGLGNRRKLLLDLDRELQQATAAEPPQVGVVPDKGRRAAQAHATRLGLSAEQQRMLDRLLTSGAGVEVIVGAAGSGKTAALAVAAKAWADSGVPVQGTALAAIAARVLQDSAGIPSQSLQRLLNQTSPHPHGQHQDTQDQDGPQQDGKLRSALPPGGVLVVDEAGMVGTRTLHRLLVLAETTGTKLVLVGDPKQLPEIDAGGLFATLARQDTVTTLVGNQRHILASELSGRSNVLERAQQLGLALDKDSPAVRAVVQRIKELENQGFQFEGADASFELLLQKAINGERVRNFELVGFRVIDEKRHEKEVPIAEATIMVKGPDGTVERGESLRADAASTRPSAVSSSSSTRSVASLRAWL